MRQEQHAQLTPEQRERMKKNLLTVGIISIVMMFAGFTSAYVVMMGDKFWVKLKMPPAFWASTVVIVLSSIVLWWGLQGAKKGNLKVAKLGMSITLVLGLAFAVLQWQGWGQLIERGCYPLGGKEGDVVTLLGKYGNDYTLSMDGEPIALVNGEYVWQGQPMSEDDKQQMIEFMEQFSKRESTYSPSNYAERFVVFYHGQPLQMTNDVLTYEGDTLNRNMSYRLFRFGDYVYNQRGDFFIQGEYGENFELLYEGQPVEYDRGTFTINGEPLSDVQYASLIGTTNTTSKFIYLFSFLHLLHLLGGLIYLSSVTRRLSRNGLDATNQLKYKLASIYWHFVDGLWIYLLLFLVFIH